MRWVKPGGYLTEEIQEHLREMGAKRAASDRRLLESRAGSLVSRLVPERSGFFVRRRTSLYSGNSS
jgi:hypothetical protein